MSSVQRKELIMAQSSRGKQQLNSPDGDSDSHVKKDENRWDIYGEGSIGSKGHRAEKPLKRRKRNAKDSG